MAYKQLLSSDEKRSRVDKHMRDKTTNVDFVCPSIKDIIKDEQEKMKPHLFDKEIREAVRKDHNKIIINHGGCNAAGEQAQRFLQDWFPHVEHTYNDYREYEGRRCDPNAHVNNERREANANTLICYLEWPVSEPDNLIPLDEIQRYIIIADRNRDNISNTKSFNTILRNPNLMTPEDIGYMKSVLNDEKNI